MHPLLPPGRSPLTFARAQSPWWSRRDWYTYLRDLLLYRSRRRYTLSISDSNPLGATDQHTRLVQINPVAVAYPTDPAQHRLVRHASIGELPFQQAIAVALVEHEAGHICQSGDKPGAVMLGYLWNALEDERQERLQVRVCSELAALFEMLGDAVWREADPTSELLDGCLLWRWEHDRPAHERKFVPTTPAAQDLWEGEIRPLVEQAWATASSDAVIPIAQAILRRLGLSDDSPLPQHLPPTICRCGGGEAGTKPDARIPPQAPALPRGARIPGQATSSGADQGNGHAPDDPAQADPAVLIAEVEPHAVHLARVLRPPRAVARPHPHPSRGDLDLERALAGHDRPFTSRAVPTSDPTEAWFILVDLSYSMGSVSRPQTAMAGAVRTTLWLALAAERAHIAVGIGGFDDGDAMIRIRDLAVGRSELALRRIAGMDHGGGTRLAPALRAASTALAGYAAQRKLLLVLHDGDLEPADAAATAQVVATLLKRRIHLVPLYLGWDPVIVRANQRVFGDVLACPDLGEMTTLLLAWLRARTR